VKYTKSTRYAIYAAVAMAVSDGPVSVADVAARYRIPEGALARVLQMLVRVGIARGQRGVGGGYHLAKKPSEISVLDVISVFDPPRSEGHCLLTEGPSTVCRDSPDCRIRRLFDEVDELARCTFASVTLETLAGPRAT
jgi:Rrf2 family protein